jgi:hypothetical protein
MSVRIDSQLGLNRGRLLVAVLLASLIGISDRSARADDRESDFETKIRPVLVGTCFRCHGGARTSGGLRVDTREALLLGGDSGPVLIPGNPAGSLLIQAIQRQKDVSAMPPDREKTLRADQVADFVAWVKAGAFWPAKSEAFQVATHWGFEPVSNAVPPKVRDKAWVSNSVDAFIRAKQEAVGVHAAPAADRLTLIRRATFDLTGLPPTPAEVQAFQADQSPHAFRKVVDRLLDSPRYGETWGRHWLDVVRYADTAGETADYPVPLAWRYRNYVIDAFNTDKPYDEFVREQIAGDVLAVQGPRERYAERATATGYLAISRRFGFDSENYQHLTIQDTIDTLGQSILGLSLGCARCHDHKFDPISMNDYYSLYGIFDSSRYAFPGSEQKQRVRSMLPLLPPDESSPKWHAFDARVASLAASLQKQQQPVPGAILRSLNDLDGDFELQAAAAGGSNGVLVPPWLYEGTIAVTGAAQSPFKNLYPLGKVGISVPEGTAPYRMAQALYPRRSIDSGNTLHVNFDFRVAAPDDHAKSSHRFWIGSLADSAAAEMLISSESVSLKSGDTIETICVLNPNQWHNIQLIIDLKNRRVLGTIGRPGSTTELAAKPLSPRWNGTIDSVVFDSYGTKVTQSGSEGAGESEVERLPAIEFDNLGVQESPFAPVSTAPTPNDLAPGEPDSNALQQELVEFTGFDGDFEMQSKDAPPASPWHPGPNSVVILSANSQSPFRNHYSAGELGIHMPNRAAYDGFGRTLTNVTPGDNGRVFVSFDFRCATSDDGGNGTWRYYLGHGPGNSAAIELFFNRNAIFKRSGDAKNEVSPLCADMWYQVQLTLDLNEKTYTGVLSSLGMRHEFGGQFATGWDGTIDYTFIDSYGHIGGVRPALDADNFLISKTALTDIYAAPVEVEAAARATRRARVAELRQQLDSLKSLAEASRVELNTLLAEGPCAMTYGMSEGTPHNVRIHLRGEPDQPGAEVPRGFIKVLGGGPLPAGIVGSGRLELAHWLTRPDNPLTARVIVNRIWQYHFGRGLVKTPNDFGVRGQSPTHPELLDHLAAHFIRSGWSMKSMHRLIMLSSTYQQSSDIVAFDDSNTQTHAYDPTDLYVSFSRRRLSAEEIRDSILAVSGDLDLTPAQAHPFPNPINWGFTQHAPFGAVYDHDKRSIYLMSQRLKRHPFIALFDGPDPNATTANRLMTTVPTQALFFLNDPLVHTKAEAWAMRLQAEFPNDSQRIKRLWEQATGRAPTEVELREAFDFLAEYRTETAALGQENIEVRSLAAFMRTLLGSNEFLHVD